MKNGLTTLTWQPCPYCKPRSSLGYDAMLTLSDLAVGASGCEFPPNAPLVNARAMVEAAKTYGTYA